jgi:hypothetical protein
MLLASYNPLRFCRRMKGIVLPSDAEGKWALAANSE